MLSDSCSIFQKVQIYCPQATLKRSFRIKVIEIENEIFPEISNI